MEERLHRKVVAHVSKIPFVRIKNYEYRIGLGEGDFLLENIKTCSLTVLEVKYIDLQSSGKTVRTRRNKHRNKVRQQAWTYARDVHEKYPHRKVNVYIYTNETGFQKLGEIPPRLKF
tara:strand:- start:3795 stop:4145 length:351 start_codon:yes stop_codon:yes gene_type:complete